MIFYRSVAFLDAKDKYFSKIRSKKNFVFFKTSPTAELGLVHPVSNGIDFFFPRTTRKARKFHVFRVFRGRKTTFFRKTIIDFICDTVYYGLAANNPKTAPEA